MTRAATILDLLLVLVALCLILGACSKDMCTQGHRTPVHGICLFGDRGAVPTRDAEVDRMVDAFPETYRDPGDLLRVYFLGELFDCGYGPDCTGLYTPGQVVIYTARLEAQLCFAQTAFAHEYLHHWLATHDSQYQHDADAFAAGIDIAADAAYTRDWCGQGEPSVTAT